MNIINYPASYARMRALKGKLIGKTQLESFLGTPDVETIISALGQTVYGEQFGDSTDLPWIEHSLKQDMIVSYIKILAFMDGRSGRFVETLLGKFELLNLKSIIRSLVHDSDKETEIDPFIFSLGKYHTIPMEEALKAGNLENFITLMKKTPFSRPLEIGYQQYESENRLFHLEFVLDLDYYERLWKALDALGPLDKRNAGKLMGIQCDITNLLWIFRFKEYYGFSPEQIFQYIIPHGWRVQGKVFEKIVTNDNIVETIVALHVSPYADLLRSVSQVDDSPILGVESCLLRYLYRESLNVFMKFPLQAAQLVAFFICKEMEIKDIITVLAGKHMGLPQERIRSYMITL